MIFMLGLRAINHVCLFKGPAEKFLQQDQYLMKHEQLGELNLFMVPLGGFQDGFKYEVVFNN
jgi:hypothetical protein